MGGVGGAEVDGDDEVLELQLCVLSARGLDFSFLPVRCEDGGHVSES